MDLSQTTRTVLPPLDAFVPGVPPLFVLRLCGAMNICFPSALPLPFHTCVSDSRQRPDLKSAVRDLRKGDPFRDQI